MTFSMAFCNVLFYASGIHFRKSSSDKRRKSTKHPKSNSHSQTKRPEPSDGFLKYLEDEVSVGRVKTRILRPDDTVPLQKEDIGTGHF